MNFMMFDPDEGMTGDEIEAPNLVYVPPDSRWIGSPEWYISPSAYLLYKRDPVGFFERYETSKGSFRQNLAMAAGTMFDYYVKIDLAKDLGILDSMSSDFTELKVGDSLLERYVDVEEMVYKDACERGAFALEQYKRHGAYEWLLREMKQGSDVVLDLDEKVSMYKVTQMEIAHYVGVKEAERWPDGRWIVVREKTDARWVSRDGYLCILDWKAKGGATMNASPTQGWNRAWGGRSGYREQVMAWSNWTHEDFDWATQLGTYAECEVRRTGHDQGLPVKVMIHEACFRKTMTIAEHRGLWKVEESSLREGYREMGLSIWGGNYVDEETKIMLSS